MLCLRNNQLVKGNKEHAWKKRYYKIFCQNITALPPGHFVKRTTGMADELPWTGWRWSWCSSWTARFHPLEMCLLRPQQSELTWTVLHYCFTGLSYPTSRNMYPPMSTLSVLWINQRKLGTTCRWVFDPCRPTKRPTKTCKGGATRLRVAAGKGTESEERRRGERTEEKEMPFFY